MRRVAFAIGLAALVSFTLSAQRRSAPAPRPSAPRVEKTVPFHVGETLTYDVSWSSYVTAGTATSTVKEKKASFNSTAYYIVAEGRPTPLVGKLYSLYYKLDTLLDSYTLLPQRGSVYSEEGSRHRFKITQFDRKAQKALFEYQTDHTMKTDYAVSPVVQDALSAVYVLRAIPLRAGDRMTMPVADGGANYKVQVDVAGATERVRTPIGELPAWRVRPTVFDDKGKPVGRNMAIWLSDEPRHLPLKFQAELPVGSFNLVLREAR
jgi:uncharacterized protein DUF3108